MHAPARALLASLHLNLPGLDDRLFSTPSQLITTLTHPAAGILIAEITSMIMIAWGSRVALSTRHLSCYLGDEPADVSPPRKADLERGAIVGGPSTLWDPIHG